jgi:lipopolysaccharide transport system ATP-binding protein
MSQRDIAISVRHLSKSYVISHETNGKSRRPPSFRDVLADRIRDPLGKTPKETFWALEDVSFEVNKGDVVGIIGRNGAGKSTLLKILSRITRPARGEIDIYGRVGSLLEVGTGFHPELTGRENIYLNGAILGMRRAEIRRQFDAIVDFSGVEQFLDTPVKRYSSGMYVRLAFGVASHLQSEVLIVDEVLAVGDTSFQKRCLGKMKNISETGRTVLFVSHNMAAVQSLCKAVVVLKSGRVEYIGDPQESISRYLKDEDKQLSYVEGRGVDLSDRKNADEAGYPILRGVRVLDEQGEDTQSLQTGATLSVRLAVEGLSRFPGADVGILFRSEADQSLGHLSTVMFRKTLGETPTDGGIVEFNIGSFPFTPGTFWIDCYVAEEGIRYLDRVQHAVQLSVVGADVYGSGYELRREHAVTVLDATARWATAHEQVACEVS